MNHCSKHCDYFECHCRFSKGYKQFFHQVSNSHWSYLVFFLVNRLDWFMWFNWPCFTLSTFTTDPVPFLTKLDLFGIICIISVTQLLHLFTLTFKEVEKNVTTVWNSEIYHYYYFPNYTKRYLLFLFLNTI